MSSNTTHAGPEEELRVWRQDRWNEIVGPGGKASVAAKTVISGSGERTVEGIPGTWRINDDGDLTVTATAADGIRVGDTLVEGAVVVLPGRSLTFAEGQVGMVGGADGSYGLVVLDEQAIVRSGLTGIDAYPYDPRWILRGVFKEVEPERRTLVERLTQPRTTDHMPASVDLAFTIDGTDIE